MKPRTEAELHKAIIVLAKMMAIDRALPERRVKLLKIYHIPNGVIPMKDPPGTPRKLYSIRGKFRRLTPLEFAAMTLGKRMKDIGVKEGMPDLHLPVSSYRERIAGCWNSRFLSLYMELKLPGKPVPEYQRLIHEELREEGNRVEVVRDTLEAERIFKEHLAL